MEQKAYYLLLLLLMSLVRQQRHSIFCALSFCRSEEETIDWGCDFTPPFLTHKK